GTNRASPAATEIPATKSPNGTMNPGPPVAKVRRCSARIVEGAVKTPGNDNVHSASAERASIAGAAKPPNMAIEMPATFTPRNLRRLAAVAAKMPRGTDEPNIRNAPTRSASGCWEKNPFDSASDWNGDGKCDPPATSV